MKFETVGLPPPGWQWLRRAVQVFAILLLFALPILARYHNYVASRKTDAFIEKWEKLPQGKILAATDKLMRSTGSEEKVYEGVPRRNRKEVMTRTERYRGSVWSIELAGVSMTDPLAVAESASASHSFPWVLAVGLFIPLIVTILLGRIFCSWICPMNTLFEFSDKLRGALKFLEIPPKDTKFSTGNKYVLLGMGLLAAWLFAIPILGYFYPPAILGREAHSWVNAFFDRAEQGRGGIRILGGLSIASGFLLALVLLEVFVSRRLWCRYLCPGGALYALLGKFRLIRVTRNVKSCTDCGDCNRVCPMALNPMRDLTGIECDNCALCITHCEPRSMSFTLAIKDKPEAGPGLAGTHLLKTEPQKTTMPSTQPEDIQANSAESPNKIEHVEVRKKELT